MYIIILMYSLYTVRTWWYSGKGHVSTTNYHKVYINKLVLMFTIKRDKNIKHIHLYLLLGYQKSFRITISLT